MRHATSRDNKREYGRNIMQKTILTLLGSALIAATAVQPPRPLNVIGFTEATAHRCE